jgi:hypothetical protein
MPHSPQLFGPLIRDKKSPVWVSWLEHVKYVELMFRDSYTLEDIVALDMAVYASQKAFRKVMHTCRLASHVSHRTPCIARLALHASQRMPRIASHASQPSLASHRMPRITSHTSPSHR